MSNDKIIELGKRIPVEEIVEKHMRVAINELRTASHYGREAESSLKAFYKCLEEDSGLLAQYEAEFGVTGIKNVIYAAFPDRPQETLDDMLKDQ